MVEGAESEVATTTGSTHDSQRSASDSRGDSRGEGEHSFAAGDPCGDYTIVGILGEGGFGRVYDANHNETGKPVAIKVLLPSSAHSSRLIERFVREAEILRRVDHPNIVRVIELGELDDGRPYFVMERLDGQTVSQLLRERGSLSIDEVIEFLTPIARALDAAHREGVVHRDLKSSNIMITRRDDDAILKLLDFGVAKLFEPNSGGFTTVGRRIGSSPYMAPEQIMGIDIDHRVDVYALGVLVFQMLTCQFPFRAADPAEIERLHLTAPAPAPSTLAPVSKLVDQVVLRCLAKRREERFDSASEVLRALAKPDGTQTTVDGLGIFADVRAAPGSEDELDPDDLLEDIADAIDTITDCFDGGGYTTVLQTGSTLLMAGKLSDDLDENLQQRELALEAALQASASVGADFQHLSISIAVHGDRVDVEGDAVVGGPITELAHWMGTTRPGRVAANDSALAGIFRPDRFAT